MEAECRSLVEAGPRQVPGVFRTVNTGLKQDIEFAPFYEMPRRRYAIYWDVFTPTDWTKKSAAYEAEAESDKKLTAATIGFAQPGQMQSGTRLCGER